MVNQNERAVPTDDGDKSSIIEGRPTGLWVTCSDAPPGLFGMTQRRGVLIHSNPGNLALSSDLSFLASLSMAIDVYGVGEIVVCGHYGCRSIESAASNSLGSIAGEWLSALRAQARSDRAGEQANTVGKRSRTDSLVETNVIQQTLNVSRSSVVRDAWASGGRVAISGAVFDPRSGTFISIGEAIEPMIFQ